VSDVLCYDVYDGALLLLLSFGPNRRENFRELMIGHFGLSTQSIAKNYLLQVAKALFVITKLPLFATGNSV
jgi:hypothetical protein